MLELAAALAHLGDRLVGEARAVAQDERSQARRALLGQVHDGGVPHVVEVAEVERLDALAAFRDGHQRPGAEVRAAARLERPEPRAPGGDVLHGLVRQRHALGERELLEVGDRRDRPGALVGHARAPREVHRPQPLALPGDHPDGLVRDAFAPREVALRHRFELAQDDAPFVGEHVVRQAQDLEAAQLPQGLAEDEELVVVDVAPAELEVADRVVGDAFAYRPAFGGVEVGVGQQDLLDGLVAAEEGEEPGDVVLHHLLELDGVEVVGPEPHDGQRVRRAELRERRALGEAGAGLRDLLDVLVLHLESPEVEDAQGREGPDHRRDALALVVREETVRFAADQVPRGAAVPSIEGVLPVGLHQPVADVHRLDPEGRALRRGEEVGHDHQRPRRRAPLALRELVGEADHELVLDLRALRVPALARLRLRLLHLHRGDALRLDVLLLLRGELLHEVLQHGGEARVAAGGEEGAELEGQQPVPRRLDELDEPLDARDVRGPAARREEVRLRPPLPALPRRQHRADHVGEVVGVHEASGLLRAPGGHGARGEELLVGELEVPSLPLGLDLRLARAVLVLPGDDPQPRDVRLGGAHVVQGVRLEGAVELSAGEGQQPVACDPHAALVGLLGEDLRSGVVDDAHVLDPDGEGSEVDGDELEACARGFEGPHRGGVDLHSGRADDVLDDPRDVLLDGGEEVLLLVLGEGHLPEALHQAEGNRLAPELLRGVVLRVGPRDEVEEVDDHRSRVVVGRLRVLVRVVLDAHLAPQQVLERPAHHGDKQRLLGGQGALVRVPDHEPDEPHVPHVDSVPVELLRHADLPELVRGPLHERRGELRDDLVDQHVRRLADPVVVLLAVVRGLAPVRQGIAAQGREALLRLVRAVVLLEPLQELRSKHPEEHRLRRLVQVVRVPQALGRERPREVDEVVPPVRPDVPLDVPRGVDEVLAAGLVAHAVPGEVEVRRDLLHELVETGVVVPDRLSSILGAVDQLAALQREEGHGHQPITVEVDEGLHRDADAFVVVFVHVDRPFQLVARGLRRVLVVAGLPSVDEVLPLRVASDGGVDRELEEDPADDVLRPAGHATDLNRLHRLVLLAEEVLGDHGSPVDLRDLDEVGRQLAEQAVLLQDLVRRVLGEVLRLEEGLVPGLHLDLVLGLGGPLRPLEEGDVALHAGERPLLVADPGLPLLLRQPAQLHALLDHRARDAVRPVGPLGRLLRRPVGRPVVVRVVDAPVRVGR
mmetsp:Transcript_4651/g.10942  ORF Transcript_4651/g.10942 Transcript_4651/m.10942 type:complete len:1230 (+) Transcript_4651:609-4298(+)